MASSLREEHQRAKVLLERFDSESQAWEPDGAKWPQWETEVKNLIRRAYGDNSKQEGEFVGVTEDFLRVAASGFAGERSHLGAAFRGNLPSVGVFLRDLVNDLGARSYSAPRGVPQKYLLTSPVYWAEQIATWLRLGDIWRWVKVRKIVSIIVGGVSVIGSLLGILRFFGIL